MTAVLMKRLTRIVFVAIGAMLALGSLSACSGGSAFQTTRPSPQLARYGADMKSSGGEPMTIGISVDDRQVVAYACSGTDDVG